MEAEDGEGTGYGDSGFYSALVSAAAQDPDTLLQGVMDDFRAFVDESTFDDDICLVCLELKNGQAPTPDSTS